MGYDCTLHLVDESAFRRFTARFLRAVHETPAFDEAFEVDNLIAEVKNLIAESPARGAKALGELALLFVSTETPHLYSRGFSLSLWREDMMGAELPAKLMGSVEIHLRDIIAAYPKCAGRVPDMFTENYMVGPFVTANNVPKLLAYLDEVIEAMIPGNRKDYLPLRNLLRVAMERGLAYWEGTDLGVAQTHEEWLDVPPPAGITTAPCAFTSVHVDLRAATYSRWLVFESWRFHDVDISTWPPATSSRDGVQVTVAALTPWGTTIKRVSTDPEQSPYVFAQIEEPTQKKLDLPYEMYSAYPTRDAVLVFPPRFKALEFRKDQLPMIVRPSGITPLAVPKATKKALEHFAMSFGDGTTLVIWDGIPYRWDGTTVTPLGEALEMPDGIQAAVALPDGSIAAGFGRKLIRIDREGNQSTLAPMDNVMGLALGPDEALLVTEGDHPESDVMKVLWTGTRELTHVEPDLLGLDQQPRLFYYDVPRAQLVVLAPKAWHAIPWATLAALPRVPLATYEVDRAELVARSKAGDEDDGP